ncbi:acyltransferase domain-containing protein [Actinosynnema pretiosum subsp. pretiosum]|uniref:Acyltransferase domain-containing protein n=1 Tax=Actinosynnema pretiosum subsp. pretiosum TaxID=103721 RepID=A0AA45L6K5_9PSEU|nr:Malonyl CoA-acyl carrier protein transacylase [Actinosynnema pretiosum subsp. pretiosum]QUF03775.1 acyltransferase domain-containing protein [Actinosynnema pretiosum subsp. pretiosum]
MSTSETRERARAWLIGWVATRLAIPEHAVSTVRPLDELGLSSTDVISMTGSLGEHLGAPLSPDAVFEYPSISLLADHVATGRPATGERPPEPEDNAADPVAVVGIGCRFPSGVRGPDAFWDLLVRGGDVVGRVPEGRWDAHTADPGVAALVAGAAGAGGFLDDVDRFDAAFFGVPPKEAEVADPQQRQVLEVAWEALDHAGIPQHGLAGTRAGVFLAAGAVEYLPEDASAVDGWTTTGSSAAVIANRLSYALGARGPSMVVDTACSGSLVAIHLACAHLLRGECDLALAGGVNLLLTPGVSVGFARSGVLSPDGRCKTFDAGADGYARGEGCGVVVLKRLSRALRDGDRVLAVVRGSAVGSHGRSNGLMAPHPGAQEDLIRTAHRAAGVDPRTVDLVETHGTGTALGDPVEVNALTAVHAPGRPADRPLLLGAVKTNLGHLEAASGVAGFIKAVLALDRGEIPANLHLTTPNPLLRLDERPLAPVTALTAWPHRDHPRRAGVSSFGFGGAIAHAVLEQAPAVRPHEPPEPDGSTPVVLLSAGSRAALRAEARALRSVLDGDPPPVADLAHTLTTRRSHGPVRAGLLARDAAGLAEVLTELAEGREHPDATTGAVRDDPAPVFVFSGQGSQWAGMADGLLDHDPDFTAAIDELDPVVRAHGCPSPREALESGRTGESVTWVQPVLFTVQVALAALWRARGVEPAAVLGHSMGEVTAAVVAGALSPRDGARVICVRSRLLGEIAGEGRMAVVPETGARLRETITAEGLDDAVSVAVLLGPQSSVLSGEGAGVERVATALGVDPLWVGVDVASHSPQVDPLLGRVVEELADLASSEPLIPLYSTVTGQRLTSPPDAHYWAANLREPVRLPDAVAAAADAGHSVFLEVSPHPVLTRPVAEALRSLGVPDPAVLHTLHRERGGPEAVALAAAGLACLGATPVWRGAWTGGGLVDLPPRTWDTTRFWRSPVDVPAREDGAARPRSEEEEGPLLGPPTELADQPGTLVWQSEPGAERAEWLAAHEVLGEPVLPASAALVAALAAARDLGFKRAGVRDLVLHQPVPVVPGLRLQGVARRDRGVGAATFTLHFRTAPELPWAQAASARLHDDHDLPTPPPPRPDGVERDVARWYDLLAGHGIEFGPALRVVTGLRSGAGTAVAELSGAAPDPALLTGAFQAVAAALPEDLPGPALVTGVTACAVLDPATPTTVTATVTGHGRELRADAWLWAGRTPVAALTGIRLLPLGGAPDAPGAGNGAVVDRITADRPTRTGPTTPDHERADHERVDHAVEAPDPAWSHHLAWRATPLEPAAVPPQEWLVVGGTPEQADEWRAFGVRTRLAPDPAAALAALADGSPATRLLVFADALGAGGDDPDTAAEATLRAFDLVTALAALSAPPRLHLVTRRAHLLPGDTTADPGHAALWGAGRSAALEHPDLWGGLVDLDEHPRTALRLLTEITSADPGAQSAYRADTRHIPVLRRSEPATAPARALSGTHLIVGATGRIGPHLAAELVQRGVRHLVLVSRRGLRGPSAEQAERLRLRGVVVLDLRLDVADPSAAAALSAHLATLPPLRGVHHAAFDESVSPIAALSAPLVRRMFRAKANVLTTLRRLAGEHRAELLHLSSTTGLLGSSGLAHYAAASCFADSAASADPTTRTVVLGPCADGLAGTPHGEVVLASGLRLMPTRRAVAAALDAPARRSAVVDADWGEVDRSYATALRTPLLAELAGEGAPTRAAPRPDPVQHRELLREHVRTVIAGAMGITPEALNPRANLFALGVDSLMSLSIIRTLAATTGHHIPPTVLRERPTALALADHLAEAEQTTEGEQR